MEKPFFSIVMPVYNRENLVSVAIRSVLGQRFTNWELIVVDDGSTDGTAEKIKQFDDPRIRYHYQKNQERSRARNNGIEISQSSFICFLDSDDYYMPDHLQHLYTRIMEENERVGMYVTGATIESGEKKQRLALFNADLGHPVRYVFYKKIDMNTVCVHRSILDRYKFDPQISIGEDTHLWLRVVKDYPLIQINAYTTMTIHHGTSGMVAYYREADLKLLKHYVKGAKKLFASIDLSPHITVCERRFYISKKYRSMARSCIWARKLGGVCICSVKAMYWTPSFLFTREHWSIVKETMYMAGRIIFRKRNPTA